MLEMISRLMGRSVDRRYLQVRWQKSKRFLSKLLENRLTAVGFLIALGFLLMAAFAPVLAPPGGSDPYQMNRDYSAAAEPPLTPGHPLGTTDNGGDLVYGIIWGARLSVGLSLGVVFAITIFGGLMGGIAGYVGGTVDEFIMRIADALITIPGLIGTIAIVLALGTSWMNIGIALTVLYWGTFARVMRGEVIHVKNEEFVDAARVFGEPGPLLLVREVAPNAIQPILVQSTLYIGRVVLTASSASFIGLAPRGIAEWGVLVSQGQSGLFAGRWWQSLIPGLAVFLWAFGWNMIGDGLRDVLDPRMESE